MAHRIEYTEEMVGNAHPTKADTLNRFINLITAQGDTLHGTAAATAAALAIGAANLKKFVNAAGTLPEWAVGMNVIYGIRDPDTVSGDQSFTGVGFKPNFVIAVLGSNSGKYYWSIGGVSATAAAVLEGIGIDGKTTMEDGLLMVASEVWGVTENKANWISFDADGLTVTWVRTGTPTGAADEIRMGFFCFR